MSEQSIIYRYPVDLSGMNVNNHVNKIECPILRVDGSPFRLAIPGYGGFYTEHLEIRDNNYDLLEPGKDYIPIYWFEDASARTGREVYGAILIIDYRLRDKVYFASNIVGGDFAISSTIQEDCTKWLKDNPRKLPKSNDIKGNPSRFRPGEYKQTLWTKDGYEKTTAALEYVYRELLVGEPTRVNEADKYIQEGLNSVDASIVDMETRLAKHIATEGNPHKDLPAAVGIHPKLQPSLRASTDPSDFRAYSDVPGGDVAVPTDDVILTPYIMRFVEKDSRTSPLLPHITSTDNPHGLTAAKLGAYSRDEIDQKLKLLLPVGARAERSRRIDGRDNTGLYNEVIQDLRTQNFQSGYVPVGILGNGSTSPNHVLRGDGRWVNTQDILDLYHKAPFVFHSEGVFDTDEHAVSFITSKYSDPSLYPDGVVISWRVIKDYPIWDGNVYLQSNEVELSRFATRHRDGWVFSNEWDNYDLGVTRYRFEEIGIQQIALTPGEYDVLIVGGGGGGCGYYPENRWRGFSIPFGRTKVPVLAAGGGSGIVSRWHLVIKQNDRVEIAVGRGGPANATHGGNGEASYIKINDKVLRAAGGTGGQVTDKFVTRGGTGQSSGSSSIDFDGNIRDSNNPDGTKVKLIETRATDPSYEMYVRIYDYQTESITSGCLYQNFDSKYDHAIPGGYTPGYGDRIVYTEEWREVNDNKEIVAYRASVYGAAGGAGLGTFYTGQTVDINGKTYRPSGSGYGAGGGGLQNGSSGLISIIRVEKADETGRTEELNSGSL